MYSMMFEYDMLVIIGVMKYKFIYKPIELFDVKSIDVTMLMCLCVH